MRLLFVALLSISSLFALGEKTETMQADFIQTITDDRNSTITYRGDMIAKRPNMTMWHYREPFEKRVYITADNVTIVEPELEQAIIKKLRSSIDILAILAAAQRDQDNSYSASYNDQKYRITVDGDKIMSIAYTDTFDNNVKIVFEKHQINKVVDSGRFKAQIPEEYDIISD